MLKVEYQFQSLLSLGCQSTSVTNITISINPQCAAKFGSCCDILLDTLNWLWIGDLFLVRQLIFFSNLWILMAKAALLVSIKYLQLIEQVRRRARWKFEEGKMFKEMQIKNSVTPPLHPLPKFSSTEVITTKSFNICLLIRG